MVMDIPRVLFYYIVWHYTRAIREGFSIWKNFMWFLYHFFSIPILTKTYFSKFERLGEGYKKGIYLKHNLSTFLVNSLMRLVGVCVRSVVIIVGVVSIVGAVIFGLSALVVWILFPLLLIFSLITGLVKLF